MASASRGKNTVPKDITDQFCAITGATVDIAERLLEACSGNLEMAIGVHLDGAVGGPQTPASPLSACGSGSAQPADTLDDIRAPIPQRREVLVQDLEANFGNIGNYGTRRTPRSVFDGLRDFQAEARQQQEAAQASVPKSQKQKTLEDLFRPPIDLMFKGSFHAARDLGTTSNRWLLVNVQNAKEFQCQMLNRDVWSSAAVKALINDSFVFWQVYNDSEEGRKYMQFYNIQTWPYIAILDPQTGENLVTWNNVDAVTLCDLITEYLAEHHRPDGAGSTDAPLAKRMRKDSIIEASEDSQLQAAIRASMQESDPQKRANMIVIDSDDDYGSDADLETFSDSDDESSTQLKKAAVRVKAAGAGKSGSADSTGNGDRVDSERVPGACLVSKPHSSPPPCGVAPLNVAPPCVAPPSTPCTPSSSPSEPPTPIATSYSATPSTSSSPKPPARPDRTLKRSNTSTSTTSPRAPTTGGRSRGTENIDSVNGSAGESGAESAHASPSNGTGTTHSNKTSPHKKFQFVEQSASAVTLSSWRDHLGSDTDQQTVINIRFPDGKRQQFKVPCSTKLRALIMYVQEEGYHKEMYELVTNFPKRKLSYLNIEDTLHHHGLFPQETVFVQER